MEGESLDEATLEIPKNVDSRTNDDDDDESEQPVAKKTKETRELVVCVFCGKEYHGIGGLKRHLHYCKFNPDAGK